MQLLRGKIKFHLKLDENSSDFPSSRKRKRRDASDPLGGFSFTITEPAFYEKGNRAYRNFILSVPGSLLRSVSRAAVYDLIVDVKRYECIEVIHSRNPLALLEVFTGGLEILYQNALISNNTVDFWTLPQFCRLEITQQAGLGTAWKKELFNITARVDAISPIISMEPSAPFALMEIYDKNVEYCSAVVAFFGSESLAWHPAIRPGEVINLHGLSRKQWPVPKMFDSESCRHLFERIPGFVFVFSKKSSMSWVEEKKRSYRYHYNLQQPPFPLISLEGIVFAVTRKTVRQGRETIHAIESIDMESRERAKKNGPSILCRLFLGNFPMSTEMQLSLQAGSWVEAVNVHPIYNANEKCGWENFGACLRSTLRIIRNSSELPMDSGEFANQSPMDRSTISIPRPSIMNMVPYRLSRVLMSYTERLIKRHVQLWLESCFDKECNEYLARLPSAAAIANVLTDDLSRKRKSPYAEFFDHAYDYDSKNAVRPHSGYTCCCAKDDSNPNTIPLIITLNDVRVAGFRAIADRLGNRSGDGDHFQCKYKSVHFCPSEIKKFLGNGKTTTLTNDLVIGGFGACTCSGQLISLSDRVCMLLTRQEQVMSFHDGDFVVGRIESVVVSCFRILVPKAEKNKKKKGIAQECINLQSLPPMEHSICGSAIGGGALLRVGNDLFVASVQLKLSNLHVIESSKDIPRTPGKPSEGVAELSVSACLVVPNSLSGTIKGVVLRSRFRHQKACLLITICDIMKDQDNRLHPCFLQTLDVEVTVPQKLSKKKAFKSALNEITSSNMIVFEDECTLGVSWWTVAESSKHSQLVSGGWDEYHGVDTKGGSLVTLSIDSSALSVRSRGYIRCTSSLNDLLISEIVTNPAGKTTDTFVFIERGKVLDGMLCRRPLRRSASKKETSKGIGELWNQCAWKESPFTISDILKDACLAMSEKARYTMSPSLVRRVVGARLIDIKYCSVTYRCRSCFQKLVDARSVYGADSPSYWHKPRQNTSIRIENHAFEGGCQSLMRCPNRCKKEHVLVHWQCSGILDDGTAQAKLYADHEAALTLLGLSPVEITTIQGNMMEGRQNEVTFSKSLPPSKELLASIREAFREQRRMATPALSLLSPEMQAIYMLYRHCKSSPKPYRRLGYYVRCKPLSDNISHLNHDSIDTYTSTINGKSIQVSGQAVSYRLPILKLELVDCCVHTEQDKV